MPEQLNIGTERLCLRRLRLSDAHGLFAYRSLPAVARFQLFKPRRIVEAAAFIRSTARTPDIPETWYQLGLFLNNTGDLIGDVGIHFLAVPGDVEVACTIDPDYWGQGYASESLRAVISHLFVKLRKKRLFAHIEPGNLRSRRLFEHLGFMLLSQTGDEAVYCLGHTPL